MDKAMHWGYLSFILITKVPLYEKIDPILRLPTPVSTSSIPMLAEGITLLGEMTHF